MAVLLVTYDLKRPGQDYSDFLKVLKSYTWARLSESSYAIKTNEEPKVVFNKLCPYFDNNDRVGVFTLNRPWWALESDEVMNWLKENL